MWPTAKSEASDKVIATGSSPGPRRLYLLVAVLLGVEAGALALKAWDEKQAGDRAQIETLQMEALALAERLDGRLRTTDTALRLGQTSGVSHRTLAGQIDGIDTVRSLRDAARSPDGSRLKSAASTAMTVLSAEQRAGLSETGDLVLVHRREGFATLLAIAPATQWLPEPVEGRRYTLAGADIRVGIGNPDLIRQAETASTDTARIQHGDGLVRSATACAGLPGADFHVCSTKPAPLLSTFDLARFLIYALLLAAPVLAIAGLLNLVARGRWAQAEEARRAASAEGQLELVVTGARAGSWQWDPVTGDADLSQMAADLLGFEAAGTYSRDDLLAQVDPRELDRVETALNTAPAEGWLQVAFATHIGGGRDFVELRASPTTAEGTAGPFGGIIMDVTDQQIADRRLRLAERRLRNAIEGFDGPFALWDSRRRMLYWNRAFEVDFGLEGTLRPGIGHDTVAIARQAGIREERRTEPGDDFNLIRLADGRWLQLVERATVEGGLITVGVDVSASVRAKEQLLSQKKQLKRLITDLERSEGHKAELARKYGEEKARAERAAHTKSAFLANMSHELRTPLNAINGFSEILATELYGPLGDERYRGYAEDILASGQHLLDMINDILDMAKIEAGKMTVSLESIDPVDPVDAALRMIRRKAEDKGIRLSLEAQDGLPHIDADHRAMRQMVLNLVSNAIKFTDDGGEIAVAVARQDDEVCISVTDTGIGIAREHLARLGQPFEQVDEARDHNIKGTGLGLALTRSFAEMQGGRMTLASEVGKGTRASIFLPVPTTQPEFADLPAPRDVA